MPEHAYKPFVAAMASAKGLFLFNVTHTGMSVAAAKQNKTVC